MKSSSTIRFILGSLLMGIFLLGITPRQILHDIFTDHSHSIVPGSEEAVLSTTGFQCDSQSVVAKSPFIETEICLPGIIPLIYSGDLREPLGSGPHQFGPVQTLLRGPPVLA